MTFSKTFLAGAAAFALSFVVSVLAAFAQTPASSTSMAGMDMSAASGDQGDSASMKEFQAADHSMMSGMSDVQYTGNVDHDFYINAPDAPGFLACCFDRIGCSFICGRIAASYAAGPDEIRRFAPHLS
ncbi:MAG: hypothetical protein CBARDMAM_4660, partial [uncultured Caballeronia sp.]